MATTAVPAEAILVQFAKANFSLATSNKSSNELPPKYEEAVGTLISELERKFNEDPDAAHDALIKAYGSTEVGQAYVAELEHLASTVASLDFGFRTVSEAMAEFDSQGFVGQNGQTLRFGPQWSALNEVRTLNFSDRYRN
jgi:hypothetical protein